LSERRRRTLAPSPKLEDYALSEKDVDALAAKDIHDVSQLVEARLQFPPFSIAVRALQRRLRFALSKTRSEELYAEGKRLYESENKAAIEREYEREAWCAAFSVDSPVTMLFFLQGRRRDENATVLRGLAHVVRFVGATATENAHVDIRFEYAQWRQGTPPPPDLSLSLYESSSALRKKWGVGPLTWSATVRGTNGAAAVIYLAPPLRLITELVRPLSQRGERLTVVRMPYDTGKIPTILEGRVLDLKIAPDTDAEVIARPYDIALRLWVDGHVVSFAPAKSDLEIRHVEPGTAVPFFVSTRIENAGTSIQTFPIHYTLSVTDVAHIQISRTQSALTSSLRYTLSLSLTWSLTCFKSLSLSLSFAVLYTYHISSFHSQSFGRCISCG
jgi:hypothetical protein